MFRGWKQAHSQPPPFTSVYRLTAYHAVPAIDFNETIDFFVRIGQESDSVMPITQLDRVTFTRIDFSLIASAPGMDMMRHRLRLFTGEEETSQSVSENVTVRLGDISQALMEASRWNRTWVNDFADDEVQVSSDLYEILSAYLRLRPGA